MEIRKRNGESVPFQQEKIFNAMKKAFDGQGKEIGSREMDEILATVLNNLSVTVPLTVERVQDEVERTLMERGHYEVAKAYILYREKRSALRRVRHTIAQTTVSGAAAARLSRTAARISFSSLLPISIPCPSNAFFMASNEV